MAFFRYPGGKRKLREQILSSLSASYCTGMQYREPFFGGGSIGIEFLKKHASVPSVWINDKDVGIYCIWKSVSEYPEELCALIRGFVPSIEAFHFFKKTLLAMTEAPTDPKVIVATAAAKIAIHQISFSGLGTKSGGPLGGADQESKYKIDCRWSPDYLIKKIRAIHAYLGSVKVTCTCQDFNAVISDTKENALIYLDPPYYVKGNDLYQCGFSEEDHKRLAETLRQSKMPWVLSYDDDEGGIIRSLYSWARVETITVKYSIKTAREKPELLIYPT